MHPPSPYVLLPELIEAYRETELQRPQPGDPADVRVLLKALNRHLFDPAWTLGRIEREAGLHDHNVSRRLAEHVGESPHTYRHRHRMELAKRLLRHEGLQSLPIAQIAPAVGYERLDSFARAFKRYTGCSPKQYRNTT